MALNAQDAQLGRKGLILTLLIGVIGGLFNFTCIGTAYGARYGCNVPCPDCCPPDNAPGNPKAGTSGYPVFFLNGTAIERAVDLDLPGPALNWSFSRSYDSGFTGAIGSTGWRWMSGSEGPYLHPDSDISSQLYLVQSTSAHRDFNYVDGTTWNGPKDYHATIVKSGSGATEKLTLTERDTGEVYVFYGLDSNIAAYNRGRLYEQKSRAYAEAGKAGVVFVYNSNGYVDYLIPPDPQDDEYSIDFEYYTGAGGHSGLLKRIDIVHNSVVIARAEYWYQDNVSADLSVTPSADLGGSGELVQVKVSRLTSSGTDITQSSHCIEHYTQYRYYNTGTQDVDGDSIDDGDSHQVKMVLESDAIQRAIDYSSGDSITEPKHLLALHDSGTGGQIGSVNFIKFASRSFTYYNSSSAVDTSAVDTAFTPGTNTENFHNKYAGVDFNEGGTFWNFSSAGMVKSETINGACSSCGGSASAGIVKRYYYIDSVDSGSAWEYIPYTIIEDTIDKDGIAAYRRVYGVGFNGHILREAMLTDPLSPSATNIWCRSMKLNSDWRIIEERMPSAHKVDGSGKGVDSDADLNKFFNPNSGTYDADTVSTSEGVVYYYEYSTVGNGLYQTGKRIRRGADSDSDESDRYYVAATDWINYGFSGAENVLPSASYEYPSKTTTRSSGKLTIYSYTFWSGTNGTVMASRTVFSPTVASSENGPDLAAETTTQYFDKVGRLRWTKDGGTYVNYFSYHPTTGGIAYAMVDVNDSASPGTDITAGSSGKWMAWTVDGANLNYPTRDNVPTGLELVTKHEYDNQARLTLKIDARAIKHFTLYEDNRTLRFPSWDATNNRPLMPIEVTEVNDGGKVLAAYSVDPARTAQTGGVPTGLSSGTGQSHYTTWSRNFYHAVSGQLVKSLRYHDIPSSGNGAHVTNYYVTANGYDSLGRRDTTYETVDNNSGVVEQITRTEYDDLDRMTAIKKVVSPASHSLGLDIDADSDLGTISLPTSPGLATVSTTAYDSGGVGDSHISSTYRYHTSAQYTLTEFHRTFRGFLRGTTVSYNDGSVLAEVSPYQAMDVDWMGRTTSSAKYNDTAEPNWSTLTANDGDAASPSTGQNDRRVTLYDAAGRVYRTEFYPGTSANKLQHNNYYDLRNNLVCTGEKYAAHTEYAYDGAGRLYQERTVKDVAATPYISGTFQYRAPGPSPDIASSPTGGDDGLIAFKHTEFDANGNAIAEHNFELNHTDTDGIDIDSTDSYVRTTLYNWYDAANRRSTTADYGAGDGTSGSSTWQYTAAIARPSELDWTSSAVSDGYVLLTKYVYDEQTGRLSTMASGVRKNGSDTTRMTTKTFYDDLGQRTHAVENYVNFVLPDTNVGGGTNNAEDRVTKWEYQGLGGVSKLVAYNGSSGSTQTTTYLYEDPHNASLVTNKIYPDSSDTTSAGTDQVKVEYHLDGLPSKLKLQGSSESARTIREYVYNNRRQLELDKATQLGTNIDGAVLSIRRSYDPLGRLERITSYADAAGTGTVVNEVKHTYGSHGLVTTTDQDHADAVGSGSAHKSVDYGYDADAVSDVYSDGLRLETVTAPGPATRSVSYRGYGGNGATTNVNDRLNRVGELRLTSSTGTQLTSYAYNGENRLVRSSYTATGTAPVLHYNANSDANYEGLDRFGRVVSHSWLSGASTVLDQFDYTYDYAGNRLTRAIPIGLYGTNDRDQAYSYDGLHRLLQGNAGTLTGGAIADAAAKFRQKWSLDALGNWSDYQQDGLATYATPADNDFADATDIDQDRTHNAVNEMTATTEYVGVNWANPEYDLAGNMTKIPKPLSPGNKPYVATYDAWNRLVRLTLDSAVVNEQEYDGLHRRIVRSVYASGALNHRIHYYFNDQWQVVEERKETGSVEDSDPLNQYLWHPYYVDALAMRRYDADVNPATTNVDYCYLQDANYNVTAVTGVYGYVVERYAYTPYGEATVLNGPDASDADSGVTDFSVDSSGDIENVYLYTGRERDSETGLQINRHRYYASHLGRWLTRDPILYKGGMNLYGYVDSRPTFHLDPFGEAPDAPPADAALLPKDDIIAHACFWGLFGGAAGGPIGALGGVGASICCDVYDHLKELGNTPAPPIFPKPQPGQQPPPEKEYGDWRDFLEEEEEEEEEWIDIPILPPRRK